MSCVDMKSFLKSKKLIKEIAYCDTCRIDFISIIYGIGISGNHFPPFLLPFVDTLTDALTTFIFIFVTSILRKEIVLYMIKE